MPQLPVGLLAIVCCLLPGPAFAQRDIEILPLADGSVIRFERFDGALLRLKEGRQIARVRLPRATLIERRTDVVLSKDESRLLVVHSDSRLPLSATTPRGDSGFDVAAHDRAASAWRLQLPGLASAARARDDAVPAVARPGRQEKEEDTRAGDARSESRPGNPLVRSRGRAPRRLARPDVLRLPRSDIAAPRDDRRMRNGPRFRTRILDNRGCERTSGAHHRLDSEGRVESNRRTDNR